MSFVFFSAEISLLVLILLCVGIGFAAGYLFDRWRDRRKRRASARVGAASRSMPSVIRSGRLVAEREACARDAVARAGREEARPGDER